MILQESNTKKCIRFCVCLAFLFSVSLATQAAITPGTIPTGQDIGIREPSPANSVNDLVSILASLVRWVYVVFFIITVLYILLAAYNYLTAAGEDAKIQLAHKEMKWAAVAITVAFLSVGAELIIKDFLTNKPPSNAPSNTPINFQGQNPGTVPPGVIP